MSYPESTTRTTGERVSAVSGTAQQEVKHVSQEVQGQARRVTRELQSQVSSKATEEQHKIATVLRDAGAELQSMSRSGERQEGPAHRLSEQLGQRSGELADWLDQHEPQDILDEVTSFARRRPGAFLLGALALGVVAGRATRGLASAQSDNGHGNGQGNRYGPSGQPGYGQSEYGTGATPLYDELESTATGYTPRPTDPMEPAPGLDAGTRARGMADPATRYADETQPIRQSDIDGVVDPERGTGRV